MVSTSVDPGFLSKVDEAVRAGELFRLDFETFSESPIKKAGGWAYSRHPSTKILCAAVTCPWEDEPRIWTPHGVAWKLQSGITESDRPDYLTWMWHMQHTPPAHINAITQAGGVWAFWNASFEISIFRNVGPREGLIDIDPLNNVIDDMEMAMTFAYPASLEMASSAVLGDSMKDMEGNRIMLKLSQPRKPSKNNPDDRFYPTEEEYVRLLQYCGKDTTVAKETAEEFGFDYRKI